MSKNWLVTLSIGSLILAFSNQSPELMELSGLFAILYGLASEMSRIKKKYFDLE